MKKITERLKKKAQQQEEEQEDQRDWQEQQEDSNTDEQIVTNCQNTRDFCQQTVMTFLIAMKKCDTIQQEPNMWNVPGRYARVQNTTSKPVSCMYTTAGELHWVSSVVVSPQWQAFKHFQVKH